MILQSQLVDPAFPATGDLTLWWLGQAGFAIRTPTDLLFIDPYLSDVLADKYRGKIFPHTRMHDSPVDPTQVTGLSLVLCTHGHTDHMDPGCIPLLQSRSDPLFVVPRAEAAKAAKRGVPPARLTGLDAQESLRTRTGVTVTAVPAAHEELTVDRHGQHLFLGYVIDIDGFRIYHSGDCAPYPGQHGIIRELDVDLALLPVNGRDSHRKTNGVPGNFHVEEAVQLCRAAGINRLICHHWGLFEFNTADPIDLRRRLAGVTDIEWTIPALGAPIELAAPPR